MNEDNLELLQALGSLAREQQLEHEHLEALCDDETRAAALVRPAPATLEARPRTSAINARSRAATSDARVVRATAPLSSEQQDLIADRVRHALAVERWHAPRPLGDADQKPLNASSSPELWADAQQRARLQLVSEANREGTTPATRRRGFNVLQWTGVLLPLTAAAAVALLWSSTTQPIAALPEYRLHARGSVEYRAEPQAAAPLQVAQGSSLQLELRPSVDVSGPIELRVLVQHSGGSAEWPAQIEQSPSGSLRVKLQRADIQAQGDAELRIVVARPAALAKLGYQNDPAQHGEGWQAWRVPITLP